jgi:ankyrin repeat protein
MTSRYTSSVEPEENLSNDNSVLDLMTVVRYCTPDSAQLLRAHEKNFCALDNYGDSVLDHAVDTQNGIALEIIAKSKHFNTIKNLVNEYGNYAVFRAAMQEGTAILSFLLSAPRNCKILLPARGIGCPSSLLHEVICTCKNPQIMQILLNDLSNGEKYNRHEINYIIAFQGDVQGFGQIDALSLAGRLGKAKMYELLSDFTHRFCC